jgi:CRISPR-associated protein Cas2
MFVILTYDVGQKRVSRVMKTCRKYLRHVQNSVFDGNITEAKLEKLKKELISKIVVEHDSICIYKLDSVKYAAEERIGSFSVHEQVID